MANIMIASLSEGWRTAQNDPTILIVISIYFAAIGPFLIIFAGGVDTVLGLLWLAVDITIVRWLWVVVRKNHKRYLDSKTPGGYLMECITGTAMLVSPPAGWVVANYAIMVAWNRLFH